MIPITPTSEFEKRILGGQIAGAQIDQISLVASATLNPGDVLAITIDSTTISVTVGVGRTATSTARDPSARIPSTSSPIPRRGAATLFRFHAFCEYYHVRDVRYKYRIIIMYKDTKITINTKSDKIFHPHPHGK